MSENISAASMDAPPPKEEQFPVKWYRSTFYNITILGLAQFSAPGIWVAMSSLGAGGEESFGLVNAANSLTFCLMVISCFFFTLTVRYIGVKGALIFGTVGYAPYAAGLYLDSRYGVTWLVLLGAALCGISAGTFGGTEAAVAIAYPEPWNRGKALGYWLIYRLSGQIIGGSINLGLNANRDRAGKVSYTVYLVFIALQAAGPFVALLLNKPKQVQRKDGKEVRMEILDHPWKEIKATVKSFFNRKFLLLILWIGQAIFAEAVYFTYIAAWFSVRVRALASFLSGVLAASSGLLLGYLLDRVKVALKIRARVAFCMIAILQGAWWTWAAIVSTEFYYHTNPTYDWSSPGFGRAFTVFIFLAINFQLNYLFLYFIITHLAGGNEPEILRYAALLRGTESGWQAISYGTTSVDVMGKVGGVYLNFALWGVAVLPAWLVIKHIGITKDEVEAQEKAEREGDSEVLGPDSKKGKGDVEIQVE